LSVEYKPLWLFEAVDYDSNYNPEIRKVKLLTKNFLIKPDTNSVFSTLINIKEEQITLGFDIFGTDDLKEIYRLALWETEDIVSSLVSDWWFWFNFKKLQKEEKNIDKSKFN
jgi:hypothetical protein